MDLKNQMHEILVLILKVLEQHVLIVHRIDLGEYGQFDEKASYKIVGSKIKFMTHLLMSSNYHIENVNKDVNLLVEDLKNYESIKSFFEGVDIVIHAACTAYEGLSVFSPYFVTSNTYEITSSTLSASINKNIKKFIYLSSMSRYGTQDSVPFIESMTPKPQDPYGIAKYASELTVKNLCETHNINYTILVPHNIIGPRQKYDDPYRNVASIMINRILNNKQPIIYGDGNQKRCFSFIEDVIKPIIKAKNNTI